MDVQSFLKGFGYAAARTKYGVTASEIEAGLKKTESGCIVDCGSSIMLIVNARSRDGLVRTAAVAYAADDEEEPLYSSGSQPAELLFENVCAQMLFALHNRMTKDLARRSLRKLGLYGKLLDGVQRSCRIDDYVYLMKMQPNGMILMVVSHN